MSPFFTNQPLWIALFAIFIAQFIKIPIGYANTRRWNWGLLFSTGGMPSSHSAAVTSLSTAIGMEEGFGSTLFAVCAVFSVIVMYDAAGIRRHAGKQAVVLNQLVEDFHHVIGELKTLRTSALQEKREKLKELLGHQPVEVLMGGLLGVAVAAAFIG